MGPRGLERRRNPRPRTPRQAGRHSAASGPTLGHPGPPPSHRWTTPAAPANPGHLWATPGHPTTQGAQAPGRMVPGVGSAEARPDSGGAQGPGIMDWTRETRDRGCRRLLTEAPRGRAAASDGPARPLQWRCGGRGARVTAGGRPKPRPSPYTPCPAAQLRDTPTPPLPCLLIVFFYGAGLQSIGISERRC